MRVLIFSESAEAKSRQAELREAGHHASLRNPYYFDPGQFEVCDQVISDDQVILDAYLAAGIAIERLTVVAESEPLLSADDAEKASKPKRGRKPNEE